MMETVLLSKRKSTLFSNYSCIIIHKHVQIKKFLRIMDGRDLHYIIPIFGMMYKDNTNGLSFTIFLFELPPWGSANI
jgi:hypothetical protein